MFGFSLLQIYLLINLLYTILSFIFLHNILVRHISEQFKESTSRDLTPEEIQTSMSVFYILSALIGTIRLLQDIRTFLFNRKECIWLYHLYKKEDTNDTNNL